MSNRYLLAIDDSESSMRAIDHLGQRLARQPDAEVTFLHVCDVPPALLEHGGSESPQKEHEKQRQLDARLDAWEHEEGLKIQQGLFDRARLRLARALQGGRVIIHTKLAYDSDDEVARAIIDEARGGRYDTVVLGRNGKSAGDGRQLGSTTSAVVHELEDGALWIV